MSELNDETHSVIICECGSAEHQILVYPDDEYKCIYLQIHLTSGGFFKRLKAGIKYIFGYKCRYGHWDEIILSPDHADKLHEITNLLESYKKN